MSADRPPPDRPPTVSLAPAAAPPPDRPPTLSLVPTAATPPDRPPTLSILPTLASSVAPGPPTDLTTTGHPDAHTLSLAGGRGGGPTDPNLVTVPEFPGYDLLGVLGQGGMGAVYEARQVGLNRVVALKVILAGGHASPEARARFLHEAEAVAALSHPGVVQVHDFGTHAGQPYIAFEFCPGGSLAGRLAGTPLPPRDAAGVVEAVARAVQAAHDRGVVHRDLKPANVLLAADGSPKVADFGLAKFDSGDGMTAHGDMLGTPEYMAPEQAMDAKTAGPPADVWALGAVLYECLTGRPPFKGATRHETVLQVLDRDPVPVRALNPAAPRDLETVCLKCLEKAPARRYPTAAALADDLRAYLDGRPVTARPVGPAERAAKWVRRHPGRAGGVAAAAAAVGLGLAYWAERVGSAADRARAESDLARRGAEADRARAEADFQRRGAEVERFHLGLSRLRERRAGGAHGWPRQNLDDLTALAASPLAPAHLPDLRSEVAAALGAVELRRVRGLAPGTRWYATAFSPDGKTLAAGAWGPAQPLQGEVRLVDVASGATARALTFPVNPLDALKAGVPDGCRVVAFSPDGRWVVAGLRFGRLVRWDLTAPGPPAPVVWAAHQDDSPEPRARGVSRLGFTADSRTLVSAAGLTVRTWDAAAGFGPLARVPHLALADGDVFDPAGVPATAAPPAGAVRPLCRFDPRGGAVTEGVAGTRADSLGGVAVAAPTGTLLFFGPNDASGPLLRSPGVRGNRQFVSTAGHSRYQRVGDYSCVRFTPDGGHLVTAEENERRLAVWDVAAARVAGDQVVPGQSSLRFRIAPDGRTVAVCEPDGVGVYELTGRVQQTVGVTGEWSVLSGAVSADGREMVVLTDSDEIPFRAYRWPVAARPSPTPADATDTDVGAYRRTLAEFAPGGGYVYVAGDPPRIFHTAHGPTPAEDPNDMRFGPDGRLWVADGPTVRVIELPGWASRTLASNDIGLRQRGMVFKSVAAGAGVAAAGRRDGTLFRFDGAGRVAGTDVLFGSAVTAVAIAADGRTVIAGGGQGEVVLSADGQARPAAAPHADAVTGIVVGDGFFATGSADGTVRLRTPAGDPVLTLRFGAGVRKLALAAGGRLLFALVDGERAWRRWDLGDLRRGLEGVGLAPGFPPPGGPDRPEG